MSTASSQSSRSARQPRTKNWVLVISMLWNCLCSCASVFDCVCGMVILSMMIGGMLRFCFVVVVLVFVVRVVGSGCGDCCCVCGDVCGGGGGVCAVVNPVLNWVNHSCVCSSYIRWW